MDIKKEIKAAIAKQGTTLKKVCETLSERTQKTCSYNNISNKLRNKTIKFSEVQEILDILNYKIEINQK